MILNVSHLAAFAIFGDTIAAPRNALRYRNLLHVTFSLYSCSPYLVMLLPQCLLIFHDTRTAAASFASLTLFGDAHCSPSWCAMTRICSPFLHLTPGDILSSFARCAVLPLLLMTARMILCSMHVAYRTETRDALVMSHGDSCDDLERSYSGSTQVSVGICERSCG